MLKKFITLGIGTTLLFSARAVIAQTLPPALLTDPNLIVFQIGSGQNHEEQEMDEAIDNAVQDDTSASSPTNVPITTSRASIMRVTTQLRHGDVTAGADSKEVVAPVVPERGFHLYTEFDWSSIEDKRGFNLDGNKFAPRIGGDLMVGPEILVGGSFTYSFEKRRSNSVALRNEQSSFAFNAYAGKTFSDWLNVGITGTYAYQHQITKAFGGTVYGSNNVFAVSPFVGVAHTFGPWSVSSTATYIFQHNDVNYDTNPPLALGGDLDSHFYLHINEVEYALTDRLSIGANANFNVVLSEDQNALSGTVGTTDDFWVTLGAKASYQLFDYVSTSVQFQADVANEDYNNYLTTVGVTWSF